MLLYDISKHVHLKLLKKLNKWKMSDWLDVNDVVEVLEEVGVQVVVLTGQCVEVNHHILLHCDMVHHVDKVQQSLQKNNFISPGLSTYYSSIYSCTVSHFYLEFSSLSLGLIAGLVTVNYMV